MSKYQFKGSGHKSESILRIKQNSGFGEGKSEICFTPISDPSLPPFPKREVHFTPISDSNLPTAQTGEIRGRSSPVRTHAFEQSKIEIYRFKITRAQKNMSLVECNK